MNQAPTQDKSTPCMAKKNVGLMNQSQITPEKNKIQ
jgi:hypothetical protein